MIILASASPRRKELLSQICDFEVKASQCDENCDISDPCELVCELSRRKARAVAENDGNIVIGADTVVAIEGSILGKPRSEQEAKDMLKSLSGKTHSVFTGVTVIRGDEEYTFAEKTDVTFYELSDHMIDRYVASGEPMDKAGAYGIQGKGCVLVKGICGDYFNVVGLPVAHLYRVLDKIGGINADA
jgi:septum formation protein